MNGKKTDSRPTLAWNPEFAVLRIKKKDYPSTTGEAVFTDRGEEHSSLWFLLLISLLAGAACQFGYGWTAPVEPRGLPFLRPCLGRGHRATALAARPAGCFGCPAGSGRPSFPVRSTRRPSSFGSVAADRTLVILLASSPLPAHGVGKGTDEQEAMGLGAWGPCVAEQEPSWGVPRLDQIFRCRRAAMWTALPLLQQDILTDISVEHGRKRRGFVNYWFLRSCRFDSQHHGKGRL